ncbi:MAG: erythrose-4-phosphate dehydrogenase [Desulfotalea sp.]
MSFNIAINGYGRIGQSVLRAIYTSPLGKLFKVKAINELADIETICYLTKYDTTHGRFPTDVSCDDRHLYINKDKIKIISEENPDSLPWAELDIDLVFECSGSFSKADIARKHITSGARKILVSHPNCADVDATIVFGTNQHLLKKSYQIASNASCTTNCIVPVLNLLNKSYGVENGVITTVHSAMNDQPVIDSYHNTNMRLTRSALQSIVPVETSLAKGIERIFPEFKDLFQCLHLRVPTINVSLLDLSVNLKTPVTSNEINKMFQDASTNGLKGLMGITKDAHASVDFNGDSRSCIIDASQTRVCQERLLKLICWFDNEWAFANRMLDVGNYWLNDAK